MRAITLIILAVFTMTAYAQKTPVEKFIKKQSRADGISVQEIDVKSEDFKAQFKVEGGEAEEMLQQIDMITILSSDSTATSATKQKFMEKAGKALEDERYTELAIVRSDGDDVGLYANKMENGLINEMIVLIGGGESAMLVYMKGELDMANMLSSEMLGGMMGGKKSKDCE